MSNIVVSGTGSASLSALIQQYYMPVLYDQIFKKSHPLLALLKSKAKTFNGREIVVPVEYADGSASVWGDQHTLGTSSGQSYTPAIAEIAKTASYNPTMLTGHFLLTKEETLLMNSPQAIKNIVGAKVKNLQKSLEKKVAQNLFATSLATDAFNPVAVLCDDSSTVGGIAPGSNAWWKTPVLSQASFSGDTGNIADDSPDAGAGAYISKADMVDSSKDTYILKILARGVANARGYTGENPDVIVCPQEIYDLIENEIDPRKTGSKMSERMGSMGFTALNFRGIDIVADQDMVSQQDVADDSNDRYGYDGRIYFLNTNYLYMFFNSGAKFTAGDMIEDTKSNTFVQKVHTYGNLAVTNRRAHCVITGLESSPAYAPYG
jgi:hypothetical protein